MSMVLGTLWLVGLVVVADGMSCGVALWGWAVSYQWLVGPGTMYLHCRCVHLHFQRAECLSLALRVVIWSLRLTWIQWNVAKAEHLVRSCDLALSPCPRVPVSPFPCHSLCPWATASSSCPPWLTSLFSVSAWHCWVSADAALHLKPLP